MHKSHVAQRMTALRLKAAILAAALVDVVAAARGNDKAQKMLSAAAEGKEEVVLDVLRECSLPLATSSKWEVFVQLRKLVEGLIDAQAARSARMLERSLAYAEHAAFA